MQTGSAARGRCTSPVANAWRKLHAKDPSPPGAGQPASPAPRHLRRAGQRTARLRYPRVAFGPQALFPAGPTRGEAHLARLRRTPRPSPWPKRGESRQRRAAIPAAARRHTDSRTPVRPVRNRRGRGVPAVRAPLEAAHARREPVLLPATRFSRGSGGRPIASVTPEDVQAWFASLRATPVAADRSAPVLSVILREAEAYGYRPEDSNPCRGIRRYRRRGSRAFPFAGGARPARPRADPSRSQPPRFRSPSSAFSCFTGCRKREVLDLAWTSYREGRLFLPDSKTGPRTVWLSSPARAILDGLPRPHRHVFPRAPRPGPEPGSRHGNGFAPRRDWKM